jgi:hypothetical protein
MPKFGNQSKENNMVTPKILEARPLDGYKIWLKFNDGIAGEVGLSHLTGKGVFTFWEESENFKKVSIENGRSLAWSDEIDLDADSLYLKLTGKKPEELFPALKEQPAHA